MSNFCKYYQNQECRSCEWIELPYAQQLAKKESLLRSTMQLPSGFLLEKTTGSAKQGFRNRAKMSVTGTSDQPVIGLIGEEKLDQGRELLHCPIHHPKLNEVISAMPSFIREYNLIPYQIKERKGELKGLILFYSPLSDQMYLRFILRSKECVSRIKKLLPSLQKQFPFLVCVSANIQPVPHAILEGKEEIFITDRKSIDHRLGSLTLQLSPQAFVQTNVEVATRLYQMAADWIADTQPEKMLELFCGQGAFSFFAAQSAKKILGVEISESAVATANETANKLGLTHLSFESMDAKASPSWNADLILVNPPRRGLGESIAVIEREAPEFLIYSSCSIESLSDDLRKLSNQYQLKKAAIFDLFPHTSHFEILTLLQKSPTSS